MDLRVMGYDPILSTLYHILDDDNHPSSNDSNKSNHARTCVRDAKAMASTPADVKEYPNAYVFVVDMPGLKSGVCCEGRRTVLSKGLLQKVDTEVLLTWMYAGKCSLTIAEELHKNLSKEHLASWIFLAGATTAY